MNKLGLIPVKVLLGHHPNSVGIGVDKIFNFIFGKGKIKDWIIVWKNKDGTIEHRTPIWDTEGFIKKLQNYIQRRQANNRSQLKSEKEYYQVLRIKNDLEH